MIPPSRQWCIQIDVTNKCHQGCSNCTRSLAHVTEPFEMTVAEFKRAVDALRDFPAKSGPNPQNDGVKVVGIIGGEPTLHPEFKSLCALMEHGFTSRQNRGLWTSSRTVAQHEAIRDQFGYINFNPHSPPSRHHPILVAIKDVITDHQQMWQFIDKCPYQTTWSSSITPKGFFFCEVAAALDMVFHGPGGLPVKPGCWRRPLDDFREQIERWCPRCGGALPLSKDHHRLDSDGRDDVSPSNLEDLQAIGSPRIKRGDYVLFGAKTYFTQASHADNPLDYMGHSGRGRLPLPAPEYTPGNGRDRIMLASETFVRHMTNEGQQLQQGMEDAGYSLWGRYLQNDEVDVRRVLDQTNPRTVIVQDKREWDPDQGGCFDKTVGFVNTPALAERPDIFKVTVCKDAHAESGYHERAHDEIGCHAWIIYYHPIAVMRLAPWLRREHLIRTYHSVDEKDLPHLTPHVPEKEALVSGALDPDWTQPEFQRGSYPLRTRLARAIILGRLPHITLLPHPGYHAKGATTPAYLQTLSQYKVSICTASVYGYALRKIIESTACGCVVITDLPETDVLPGIDGNLHRIPSDTSAEDVNELARKLADNYDPELQFAWAMRARERYQYQTLCSQLAQDIENMRSHYADE